MMNPVCSQCHVEMRCHKNGVTVAPSYMEHHQRSGDEFACPKCGVKVVMNFGAAWSNHETQADLLVVEG
jgi:uncharacterized ferredoxin-like protein